MKKDSTAYGAIRPAYDKSDCSVRALAVATSCTYQQASAVFSAAGRQLKRGTPQDISQKVYAEWLGMRLIPEVAGWPLIGFVMAYPKGRFIAHRKGHAFAIVDGVLHDWEAGSTKPGSRLKKVWEVTETARLKMDRLKELFS